jgi:hypothetical protein
MNEPDAMTLLADRGIRESAGWLCYPDGGRICRTGPGAAARLVAEIADLILLEGPEDQAEYQWALLAKNYCVT